MKIRLFIFLFVIIATLGIFYGSRLGLWHWGWAFLPLPVAMGIVTWGVTNINSQMFVKTECAFDAQGKEVMLTFDDGPDLEKTPQIIDLLEKYNAKGVFFFIGKKIDQHPEIAKLASQKGHSIGSHSYHHGNLFDVLPTSKVAEELHQTEKAIENATGNPCLLFRPPYGITNPNIAKALRQFQYRVIGWNLRSLDTLIHDSEKLEKRVLKRIKPGTIILLHDTAPAVLPVLERVLVFLKENGYTTKLP